MRFKFILWKAKGMNLEFPTFVRIGSLVHLDQLSVCYEWRSRDSKNLGRVELLLSFELPFFMFGFIILEVIRFIKKFIN